MGLRPAKVHEKAPFVGKAILPADSLSAGPAACTATCFFDPAVGKHNRVLDYRRRLPHWIPDHSILLLTWRLAGSLPSSGPEVLSTHRTGRLGFAQQDERLAHSSSGPFWLRDPRVARMLEQALRHGETVRKLYVLYAWVIMPNHVHVVLEPRLALPRIMC